MREIDQLEAERLERLEQAIERASEGTATQDDWNVICFECGVNQRPVLNQIGK